MTEINDWNGAFVPDDEPDDVCLTCMGKGGTLDYDTQGDGVWAMPITSFDPCPDCIEAGKCPGCSQALTGNAHAAAVRRDVGAITCEHCGWAYDEDRFAPSEPEDYGYAPDDWPI